MTLAAYRDFVRAKAQLATRTGFECEPSEVNPLLKPHQVAMVCWAVQRGRAALFAAFGMGKTVIQLEIARLILAKSGGGRGLIVLPLGVRQEFMRDAAMLGQSVTFIRSIEEAGADGVYLTNYETVRDGKLDPRLFTVLSLDEAGCLRGMGGTKTFREFMKLFEGTATYRFVATATPSPNEYLELAAYAAFLDKVQEFVDELLDGWDSADTVISGHASSGVDFWVEQTCKRRGIPFVAYPANWRPNGGVYNPRAGFERNEQMALAAQRVVAVWDGTSPGSHDMIRRALRLKRRLEVLFP